MLVKRGGFYNYLMVYGLFIFSMISFCLLKDSPSSIILLMS